MIISDWMMPGMDGDELCRRVRAHPTAPYAYFIILTSLEGRNHVINGMRAGVDDYLSKPFDQEELEARLIAAARVTALHRRLASQGAELERLNAKLFEDSRRDHLTGLGNRKRLDEDLEQWTARAVRHGQASPSPCSISTGSRATTTPSAIRPAMRSCGRSPHALLRECRLGDVAYRYGGEEILVAFAGQALEGRADGRRTHAQVIEALRSRPSPGHGDRHRQRRRRRTRAVDAGSFSRLLARADAALYEAKRAGRNRVVANEASVDFVGIERDRCLPPGEPHESGLGVRDGHVGPARDRWSGWSGIALPHPDQCCGEGDGGVAPRSAIAASGVSSPLE